MRGFREKPKEQLECPRLTRVYGGGHGGTGAKIQEIKEAEGEEKVIFLLFFNFFFFFGLFRPSMHIGSWVLKR
jgi:hypothetical protein